MVTAQEIMTREVQTVTPETPVSIAIRILAIRKISGLPVVDENKNLKGVISEKDLLQVLIEKGDIKDSTVSEFMTHEVKSFSPEDSADTICEFLINNPFRRVPIAKDGKLLGLISRADIITLIWKTRFN